MRSGGYLLVALLLAALTTGCERTPAQMPADVGTAPGPPAAAEPSNKQAATESAGPASTPAVKPANAAGAQRAVPDSRQQEGVNARLFAGWPKPRFALVITGEQNGYMEPCGCAGLENQKGGLMRRATMLGDLKEKGWPLVPVDLGGLVERFGQQAEIKFQTSVEALRTMHYAAAGWGPDDLRLGAGTLLAATSESDGSPSRFVSANVGLFELDLNSPDRFKIVKVADRRIGITSVLGAQFTKNVNNEDIKLADPIEALEKVVPRLVEQSDVRVLLAYAPPKETAELAKRFPQFQVVVTAGGADEPPLEPRRAAESLLIELGHKGMYTVTLGFYDDSQEPIRYQRVPIDARFADSPAIKQLFVAYQDQLKELGWSGLGLRPIVYPGTDGPNDPRGKFVGSAVCGECHRKAMAIWTKTPHAHATETLTKLSPPRQFDPECISCHATGWQPQEFVPYENGFTSVQATPQLTGNGCENCHGPGAAHVAAEKGPELSQRAVLRKAMLEESDCRKCHDLDNSPEFDYSTYWPQVEHHGTN